MQVVLHDGSVLANLDGRRWVDVATDGRQRSLHRPVVAQCCLVGDPPWKKKSTNLNHNNKEKTEYDAAPDAPGVAAFDELRKDYERTKCHRLLKKQEDYFAVLMELEPHAILLRELYQFYAFQGDGGDAFTISMNEITQFVRDFEIFDKKKHVYTHANLGLAFTATNVVVKGAEDNDDNPNRELNRYEFFEMLVRIALEKYKKSMKNDPPHEKMRRLLDDHIVAKAYEKIAQADGVDEMREQMNAAAHALGQVDGEYGDMLQDLFVYSCKLNNRSHKKRGKKKNDEGIEMDAFFELLTFTGLVDNHLTQLEVRQSFVDSQDDGVMGDARVADFGEFREALIRISMEKWEGDDNPAGRAPLDVKFRWTCQALQHLYDACKKVEGKTLLKNVVSSKLIHNHNLEFPQGAFVPLEVGIFLTVGGEAGDGAMGSAVAVGS